MYSNATTPNASSFDRPNRLKGREEGIIRWGELLEKFRSVQDRARRLQRMAGGGPGAGDLDDPTMRLGDGSAERGGGPGHGGSLLDVGGVAPGGGGGGGQGSGGRRGPVPVMGGGKETPPLKPEPKPRSGLGRQFGRLGGAVAGRGKR